MVAITEVSASAKIRVVLVDDHPLVRQGMRLLLNCYPDMEVIAEVDSGQRALQAIPALQPDVVLMDISFGEEELNGIHVISQLNLKQRAAPVIVLTNYDEPTHIIHAMRAGAAGFCGKEIEIDRLADAIRQVHAGQFVILNRIYNQRELNAWLAMQVQERAGAFADDLEEVYAPLSPRQLEVLTCVVHGLSNQEVARSLHISEQTVKNHMSAILKRLKVQDRTQAAVLAVRMGWVRPRVQ
ncbi:MAG: response regulator transcription factor [Anaerolineae bacterium]|nr:response regulator transcription factor [Anaerolineae bacterium]